MWQEEKWFQDINAKIQMITFKKISRDTNEKHHCATSFANTNEQLSEDNKSVKQDMIVYWAIICDPTTYQINFSSIFFLNQINFQVYKLLGALAYWSRSHHAVGYNHKSMHREISKHGLHFEFNILIVP